MRNLLMNPDAAVKNDYDDDYDDNAAPDDHDDDERS